MKQQGQPWWEILAIVIIALLLIAVTHRLGLDLFNTL